MTTDRFTCPDCGYPKSCTAARCKPCSGIRRRSPNRSARRTSFYLTDKTLDAINEMARNREMNQSGLIADLVLTAHREFQRKQANP